MCERFIRREMSVEGYEKCVRCLKEESVIGFVRGVWRVVRSV